MRQLQTMDSPNLELVVGWPEAVVVAAEDNPMFAEFACLSRVLALGTSLLETQFLQAIASNNSSLLNIPTQGFVLLTPQLLF